LQVDERGPKSSADIGECDRSHQCVMSRMSRNARHRHDGSVQHGFQIAGPCGQDGRVHAADRPTRLTAAYDGRAPLLASVEENRDPMTSTADVVIVPRLASRDPWRSDHLDKGEAAP